MLRASAIVLLAHGAAVAGERPEAFLHRVYAPYFSQDATTPAPGSTTIYAADLAALIRDDAALHPGEVGALDADPICDYCQDRCGFKAYAARLSPAGRGRVLARVRYVDCGTRSSLRLRLAAIAGGWRVADVEARSVPSLVAYLARANRQAAREESAQAFMRRIYEPILAGSDAMSPEDPPPPDTYDARLGALFERSSELADRKGIIPPIDGEPLCDCQDWSPLQNFSIRLQRCGGRTCEAEIGFVSDDRPTRLSFDLVRTDEGGRVADLGSAEDPSLRADLRKWIKQEQKN